MPLLNKSRISIACKLAEMVEAMSPLSVSNTTLGTKDAEQRHVNMLAPSLCKDDHHHLQHSASVAVVVICIYTLGMSFSYRLFADLFHHSAGDGSEPSLLLEAWIAGTQCPWSSQERPQVSVLRRARHGFCLLFLVSVGSAAAQHEKMVLQPVVDDPRRPAFSH